MRNERDVFVKNVMSDEWRRGLAEQQHEFFSSFAAEKDCVKESERILK